MAELITGNVTYVQGFHRQTPKGKPLFLRALTKKGLRGFLNPRFTPKDFIVQAQSLEQVAKEFFGSASLSYVTKNGESMPRAFMPYKALLGLEDSLTQEQILDRWGEVDVICARIQTPTNEELGLDYRCEKPRLLALYAKDCSEQIEAALCEKYKNASPLPELLRRHYF